MFDQIKHESSLMEEEKFNFNAMSNSSLSYPNTSAYSKQSQSNFNTWNSNPGNHCHSNGTPGTMLSSITHNELTTSPMLTNSQPSLSEYLFNDKTQSMRNNTVEACAPQVVSSTHDNNRSIGNGFTIDEIMRR